MMVKKLVQIIQSMFKGSLPGTYVKHVPDLAGRMTLLSLLVCLLSACGPSAIETHSPQPLSCTTLPSGPGTTSGTSGSLATIPVPGHPFESIATSDGQWIFVSLNSSNTASNGIAVLHRDRTRVCLLRVIPLPVTPEGLALTRDNKLLLVADYASVVFLDVWRAEAGSQRAVLGSVQENSKAIAIEVILSQDEKYAFVSNENDGTLGVIDLQRVHRNDFSSAALIGQVKVSQGPSGQDSGPVGMAISADNRYLYVTSRIDTGDPSNQGNECNGFPKGILSVVDIARAEHDPSHAAIAHAIAGCGPVRVILSSLGDVAWATDQESSILLAFKTSQLLTNPNHALLTLISIGKAPTGIALVENDRVIVIANSNRFNEPQLPQTLTLLDTKQALAGHTVILGIINVGAFPRELTLSPDGKSLYLTNYNSDTLNIIDVSKLPKP